MAFENRSIANSVQVRFVASKTGQKRTGCTVTRTRVSNAGEPGGGTVGAFEALLDLLAVDPLMPGTSPMTVVLTSHGWKQFTRTEAVAALRRMVGSSGRYLAQYALHSSGIEGAAQLAAQGVSELQIQGAGT